MKTLKQWYLWIFPALALGLCGILVYRALDHGPRIEIYFDDAEGLQAGRTPVKFRGVTIGTVRDIRLADKGVVATVEMGKPYSRYVVEGSRFWLVEPQVSIEGVTGLSALRDGNYIAVAPGDPGRPLAKVFQASTVPRAEISEEGKVFFTLTTAHLGSVSVGDPVYYRGFSLGHVHGVGLNADASLARIRVGLQRKYLKLVREGTVFWRKHAIQADMSLLGGNIKIGSLESLLKGGIEFGTPDLAATRMKPGSVFALQDKAPDMSKWRPRKAPPADSRLSGM